MKKFTQSVMTIVAVAMAAVMAMLASPAVATASVEAPAPDIVQTQTTSVAETPVVADETTTGTRRRKRFGIGSLFGGGLVLRLAFLMSLLKWGRPTDNVAKHQADLEAADRPPTAKGFGIFKMLGLTTFVTSLLGATMAAKLFGSEDVTGAKTRSRAATKKRGVLANLSMLSIATMLLGATMAAKLFGEGDYGLDLGLDDDSGTQAGFEDAAAGFQDTGADESAELGNADDGDIGFTG